MSFLTEAFKELKLLESEDFSLDKKGVEKLKDFMDADVADDFVPVIDMDMEDDSDTANGVHVGMTILGCEICNTLHYEDSNNVNVDEEQQLANVGMPCPHCYSTDGFKIIGTVAPYEDVTVTVVSDGDKGEEDVDVKVDGKEVEAKEVNESFGSWRAAKKLQSMERKGPKNGEDLDARKDKMARLKMRAKSGAIKGDEKKGTKTNATQNVLNQISKDKAAATRAKNKNDKQNAQKNAFRQEIASKLGAINDDDLVKKLKNAGFVSESLKLEAPYLDTRFDSRKSFYNKARINDTNDVLYSYETKVMEMVDGKPVLTVGENLLSATTLRHIKEWLKQKGFPAESKQQILRDYSKKGVEESLVEKKQKSTDDLTDTEIFDLVYAKLAEDGESNTQDADGNKISARLNKGVGYSAQEIFPGENSAGVSCLVVKAQTKEGLQNAIEVAQYYDCLYEVKKLGNDKFAYGLYVDYGSADLDKLLQDEGKPFAMKKKGEKLSKDQVYPIKSPLPAQTGLKKNGELDLGKTQAGDPNKSEILVEGDKALKEGMEDISITTDDTVIKVKATPRTDKETIVPPVEQEEEKVDLPDEGAEEVTDIEQGEDVDMGIDIEEVDEEGVDELGESYLKRVYDNVASFKTVGGSVQGNKIILEGIIGFKSGKKAKTSFILEAKETTRKGRVRFVGMNESISKNKSAYTLTGVVQDKKLMVESFNYNYLGKDSSTGKTKKLYGTIKKSK